MSAVLHVVHTWGGASQTFVRALVGGVPGTRPVVVTHEVVGPATVDAPVIALDRLRAVLPDALAGKAGVARAVAAGVRHRVALVHAHLAHEVQLADRAARALRRPLVVSLHGRDLLVELDDDPAGMAAVRRADAVIVPSPFLADAAATRGIDGTRITVIPTGVDLSELPFRARGTTTPEDGPLVLFLGRFVEKKGALDAAAAVAAVGATRPLRARFVGEGELQADVEALLAPLGRRAEVVDGRDRAAVRRALTEADLLISPSRTAVDGDAETLLLVNVEAQAAGVPVLTTDHGGITSGLGPDAAVVVPEAHPAALQAALADLVDHPERWAEMGRAGREHVAQRLTVGHMGASVAALYAALRAGRPVPTPVAAGGGEPSAPNLSP